MMICLLALVFCVFGIFKQTSAHTSRSYAELRDLILSERRHKLETQLERSLLENARAKDKFVIY